jgi:hypothetical protein
MIEQSAFDILFEKLTKRGFKPICNKTEKSFIQPGPERFLNVKYVVAPIGDLFFLASDNFSTGQYTSSTYSGIYSASKAINFTECRVYKKDWTDMLLRVNKKKSGIEYIDKNLTVTSSSDITPVFRHNDVKLFLDLHDIIHPLKIVFASNYLPVIESLVNENIVGIETNYWVYQDNELDALLSKGVQLILSLINKADSISH